MRVRRTQILPVAETAIRNAVRQAVRDALREIKLDEAEPVSEGTVAAPPRPEPAPAPVEVSAGVRRESDQEAWERFDSIRSGRYQGMSHQHA